MKKIILSALFIIPIFCIGQWAQIGSDIDGEAANDESGNSLSLSADGNVLAVGAVRNAGNGALSGHVRIYTWNGIIWTQKGNDLDGQVSGSKFGSSVELSANGNIVVIGAPSSTVSPSSPGYTAVYEWNGTNWVQRGNDIMGEALSILNAAGTSVSINSNGSIIAIGATGNSGSFPYAGHTRLYQWNGLNWVQLGNDIDGQGRFYSAGKSVNLNNAGDIVAIGAGAGGDGNCRTFHWNGTNWIQMGIDLTDIANSAFGATVSLDSLGTTLAISGQSQSNFGTGFTRIFSWTGTNWTQKGSTLQGIQNTTDFFGQAKLSADGNTLVAGAYGNSNANGYAKIFRFNGIDWIQYGNTIIGEAVADFFGIAIDINSDGSKVAIGAVYNDGNGNKSGHARVFQNQIALNISDLNEALPEINLFPNPTSDYIRLRSSTLIEDITIFSIEGKIVKQEKLNRKISTIDLSELSNGYYIIKIKTNRSIINDRIIKR